MEHSPAVVAGAAARIAVADMLAWEDVRLDLVGAPIGLEREVRWAITTELVDPSRFLHGGELVLTTGMPLAGDAACAAFVAAIAPTRPAAVGLALGVGFDSVPAVLVRAANRAGIPVVAVPSETAFVDITLRIAAERELAGARAGERRATGALLDAVRRGLASAAILQPVLAPLGGDRWAVVAAQAIPDGAARVVGELHAGADGFALAIVAPHALGDALDAASGPVGWSGPSDARGLAAALREATAARRASHADRTVTGPAQLASWEGLIERLTDEQLAPFRAHILAPLVHYDARHRARLVQTLEAFLALEGSVSQTAVTTHLHTNTVRKRLARIRSVTGLDPLAASDRMTLAVALAARR